MERIAVLGSGMAALGAAYRLRSEGMRAVLYDKNTYYGGHTASYKDQHGFIFDEGPHISFTKDARIRKLLDESACEEVHAFKARVNNYWHGYWIKHPAQCNLHGLPTDLVVDIVHDFIAAERQSDIAITTYADWLIASFGRTFAQTFPMQYTRKYHTASAEKMGIDWLGPRLYRPALREVLRGALSPSTPDVHYISEFYYPKRGGFVSFLGRLADQSEINLNHRLIRLNPRSRELRFANGMTVRYEYLISSIPLPDLIPLIDGVPQDIVEAVNALACTSCVLVNIGLKRCDISDAHWTYFYDDELCFTRVSYPHMFAPGNVPPGCGSIQVELYFSDKYRPMDRKPEEYETSTVEDLKKCGLLREDEDILTIQSHMIRYANVIFDIDRSTALEKVHGFLDDLGIHYCGRYGEWGYHWTDESFMSGERAAQRVLDRMASCRPNLERNSVTQVRG